MSLFTRIGLAELVVLAMHTDCHGFMSRFRRPLRMTDAAFANLVENVRHNHLRLGLSELTTRFATRARPLAAQFVLVDSKGAVAPIALDKQRRRH
jgi:hypothetical protein